MLLPRLRQSAPSGSSTSPPAACMPAALHSMTCSMEKSTYDGSRAYARTKRALVILTELWAEQLENSGVVVHAMHPGWADAPVSRDHSPDSTRSHGASCGPRNRVRTPSPGLRLRRKRRKSAASSGWTASHSRPMFFPAPIVDLHWNTDPPQGVICIQI